jgi:hypothetical protein
MICQRCDKACLNRTEGRTVRLGGEALFYCNGCSLLALTGSGARGQWAHPSCPPGGAPTGGHEG